METNGTNAAPPNPVESVNTGCPVCRGTVYALALTGREPGRFAWAGSCDVCGYAVRMVATKAAGRRDDHGEDER